jgi:hypothetical protein
MENFFQSFATAVRYVRYVPGMQVILARQVLFSLLVAAIPALLPVVGLRELHIDAAELRLSYASMGAGSMITAAFILPWVKTSDHSCNLPKARKQRTGNLEAQVKLGKAKSCIGFLGF